MSCVSAEACVNTISMLAYNAYILFNLNDNNSITWTLGMVENLNAKNTWQKFRNLLLLKSSTEIGTNITAYN